MNNKVKELVEYLFTNGAGEKADRLVSMSDIVDRKGFTRTLDLGGWCRTAVLSKLEEFEVAAETRGQALGLERAARVVCSLCADATYVRVFERDSGGGAYFYFHRYADVPGGGNVRRSCNADQILKLSPDPDYATNLRRDVWDEAIRVASTTDTSVVYADDHNRMQAIITALESARDGNQR